MVSVVGMCTASVMESGSHVCLRILVSDRPMVLNYQSDCLSTLFAWILISPNSVLTPSGECVGDGERKCAGAVCVCVSWRTIGYMSASMFDVLCQTWVRACGMQNMQILSVMARLWLRWWGSVCAPPGRDGGTDSWSADTCVLALNDERTGYSLIPQQYGY